LSSVKYIPERKEGSTSAKTGPKNLAGQAYCVIPRTEKTEEVV